jgi:predicted ATPase
MFTTISIEGFKSLYQIKQLPLGQINVFVGANGSGKSNLLEAIGVISAAASGRVDNESLARRGVRLSPAQLYATSLTAKDKRETIAFAVTYAWQKQEFHYTVSFENQEATSDVWQKQKHNYAASFKSDMSDEQKPHDVDPLLDALRDYAIYTPTTPILRGVQPDPSPRDPLGLFGGRLAEAVEEILDLKKEKLGDLDLSEIFDLLDWVGSFSTAAPSKELLSPDVPALRTIIQFEDLWMRKGRNLLSGYDASEGALHVLFMLVAALHPRSPQFMAIDNFGQMLNPRLERALMRLFCQIILRAKSERQILLTTHNPLALDGLDLRDKRIRLFVVERDRSSKGATRIEQVILSEKVLQTAKNGTPLSQMWVMGLLGGVPDIF